jgi:hypothetical protein
VASRLARGFKAFLALVLTGLNRDIGDQLDPTIERRLHMGQEHSSLSSATTARAGFVTKPDTHRTAFTSFLRQGPASIPSAAKKRQIRRDFVCDPARSFRASQRTKAPWSAITPKVLFCR